jgi:protein-tyrosine phosphatase
LDSCGTNGLHNGERADARTRKNALAHNIEVQSISRKITANDIQHFDLLLTMDDEVQSKVLNLCKSEEEKQKVVLFREFDPKSPGSEVPDPWYGGDEGFENVFQIVKENTEIWVNRLC